MKVLKYVLIPGLASSLLSSFSEFPGKFCFFIFHLRFHISFYKFQGERYISLFVGILLSLKIIPEEIGNFMTLSLPIQEHIL